MSVTFSDVRPSAGSASLDRDSLLTRYRSLRARTRQIFDLIDPDLYYTRPIALRNPIVFYEGHLPGFALNALVKKGLGAAGVDAHLEDVFARGIDPDSAASARPRHGQGWPSRDEVRAFVAAADARVEDALRHAPLWQPGTPVLDRAEGVFTVLEHEALHQETLLYMWHRLPLDWKRRPGGYRPRVDGLGAAQSRVTVPAGRATLGAGRDELVFGWDNEFPAQKVDVPAFAVDRLDVTNGAYLEFVEAGGYHDPRWWIVEDWAWRHAEAVDRPLFWERLDGAWHWRGQFDLLPLPIEWPVYVSLAEARAFARWRGARLMTEAEYHRAAFATPAGDERRHPWGDTDSGARTRNLRLRCVGPRARRHEPGRPLGVGHRRPRRQRVGVDDDAVHAVCGLHRDAVLPQVLGRVLRRAALRHEGRLARDGARARPSKLPQLVPPAVSVRIRDVPLRLRRAAAAVAPRSVTMSRSALARSTDEAQSSFASAVRALSARPRQIAASWLYDDLGSALFEAICALPWYRVTRAERELLEREAETLAALCHDVDFVVELGPGSGEKLALLMRAFGRRPVAPAVHLIDVSPAALSLATRTLVRAGIGDITTDTAEYLVGIDGLWRHRRGAGAALVAFLGSNIGNFHWPEAVALLRRLRARLRPGDRVLLGTDLVKPEATLLRAYDDPLGVTAAFNRNLLVRMNRELDADADLEAFAHRAVWNAPLSRVEMHLVSRVPQQIHVPGAACRVTFAAGETIWTESCTSSRLASSMHSRRRWASPSSGPGSRPRRGSRSRSSTCGDRAIVGACSTVHSRARPLDSRARTPGS